VLGSNAWTRKEATNSVVLGAGSLADRANTVSVGADNDWTDAAGVVHTAIDRQITNVAAGTESTDAVNKSQLDAVAGSLADANDYFAAEGAGDGSDVAIVGGGRSIAAGANAKATGGWASAFGTGAEATGGYSTALGGGAYAYGYESTAVGFFSEARGDYSAAFGSALAFGQGTTALGTWAFAGGDFDWTGEGGRPGNIVEIVNGTAVGFSSVAAANGATSLGAEAEARNIDSVALGNGASAQADNSVALGTASVADRANTVSVGAAGAERQITNVAAGTEATDAVNLAQLQAAQADATSHYYSVNDNGVAGGNYANDGAIGINSLAAGVNAAAIGDDSTAVGSSSVAVGKQSATFGYQSNALGDQSMALGGQSFAMSIGSTAAGYGASAVGTYSFAGGYGASAAADKDVAIGYNATTDWGGWNVAIGGNSYSLGGGVGIGYNARANGANSVSIGFNSKTTGAYGIAVGWNTTAFLGALAIGNGSQATGTQATAVQASASGWQSTAMGYTANASTPYSVALGAGSAASGQGAVAIGGSSIDTHLAAGASGWHSVSIGAGSASSGSYATALGAHGKAGKHTDSTTNADYTTSVGGEAWATEDNATAVGFNSYAQAVNATTLGNSAWTTKAATNSVALGTGSLADRANTVSVGASAQWTEGPSGIVHAAIDRQITNVAAGTEATDAVNKAQLDAVAGVVDAVAATAVSYDDDTKGKVTFAGAEGTVLTNVAAGELSVASTDAVNGSQLFETNSRVGTLETQIGDVAGVVANAVTYDDDTHAGLSLGGASGTALHNLAAGTGAMDAVNFGQLDAVAAIFGGGAMFDATGVFGAPKFMVQGGSYGNVGSAFAAIDGTLSGLVSRVNVLEQGAGSKWRRRANGHRQRPRGRRGQPCPGHW
jgi:autotransporter adhesin